MVPLLPHVGKCTPKTQRAPEYFTLTDTCVGQNELIFGNISYFQCESSLFVLELGNQSSNIWFQRNTELVALLDELR